MSYTFGIGHSLTESQCCINPMWLNGVPLSSILVSFMFCVIVRKAFAENSRSTSSDAVTRCYFPQKLSQ